MRSKYKLMSQSKKHTQHHKHLHEQTRYNVNKAVVSKWSKGELIINEFLSKISNLTLNLLHLVVNLAKRTVV